MNSNTTTLISRTADLIVEDVGEEALIYDSRTDVAHSLAATAAVVWRAARNGETLDGLAELLRARGVPDPEDTAVAVVAELQEKELLETRHFSSPGISRRRALQRMAAVGAAAAVAPFVVSATVPTAEAVARPSGTCNDIGVACSPAGSLYANNNCCLKTGTGGQLYCGPVGQQTCQRCIRASNTEATCTTAGAANFRCCSGVCSSTVGQCG
jgi:hypothetical protein